jgi:hypothetical protein
MKKLLSLLLVCALSAPLFAGAVNLTSTDNGDGTCTIKMEITDGSVVGIALDVAVNAGPDLTAVAVDSFFDIFIDAAYDEETGGDGYTYGEGQPVCLVDGPGATDIATAMAGSRTFAVCAGGLGGAAKPLTAAPAAPTTVDLLVLTGADGAAGTIDLNAIRGGIVCADATAATVTGNPLAWSISVVTTDCWGCAGQNLGDASGDGNINFADLVALKAAFGSSTGAPNYNKCADFDRSGTINFGDLVILKQNFGKTGLGVCP